MTTQRNADLSWLDNHGNIVSLAHYLAKEKGYSLDNILDFIEKPYKYNDEYKEMKYKMDNEVYPYGDNEMEDMNINEILKWDMMKW
tara:strand:+ start:8364 stop:8621 length:258 start_codon:yes stop_codon:yes gene_type:complete